MTQTTDSNNFEQRVLDRLDRLETKISADVEQLSTDVERFNDRFADYRQATQWVVQLAFTLIASATITVIVSSVLR